MKLRGRELYIIAGVVAAVICAGWYFLLFSPLNQKSSDFTAQQEEKTAELQDAQNEVVRLQGMKKSAPQAAPISCASRSSCRPSCRNQG